MSDEKISQEMAEAEFDRFVEMMDLELDPADMNDNEKSEMLDASKRVKRAIQRGSLIINDDGEAIYTPQRTESKNPFHFRELDGHALLASDKRKESARVSQGFTMMGQMCKCSPNFFANLKGVDLKVTQAIFVLLTA